MFFNKEISNKLDALISVMERLDGHVVGIDNRMAELVLKLDQLPVQDNAKNGSVELDNVPKPVEEGADTGVKLLRYDEVFEPVPVEGYGPFYLISNYGRVLSKHSNKLLKPVKKSGKDYVTMSADSHAVHRSVDAMCVKVFGTRKNVETSDALDAVLKRSHKEQPADMIDLSNAFKPIVVDGIKTHFAMNRKKEIIDMKKNKIYNPYSTGKYNDSVYLHDETENGMRLKISINKVYDELFSE